MEYFDFYLMHSQHAGNFGHFRDCRAYETAFALKAEGKIRHVGISFHDRAEVLEEILTTYPQIEVVQIQFNYVDYNDPVVQSRLCYEVPPPQQARAGDGAGEGRASVQPAAPGQGCAG